ncbi:MAG: shikimate dehydrogenase [Firmicutes bacterium]|nr:shikimate dehydrogenase [Bacillota bacterium]
MITYGLIGEHLPHSYSKEIHERLASYKYELCELSHDELDGFMRRREFKAINVTIPYKRDVIPYLDEIDEHAKKIGAVNTIVSEGGRLYGYNTDYYGLCELIKHAGITIKGKKVLILGTGGTSKTSVAVAGDLGAESITVVSRNEGGETISYERAYEEHSGDEIIINTTPCGMFPFPDGGGGRVGLPIDISRFPNLSGVIDAIYNPLRTNLILDAKARGIPAEGGLYMLVAQAKRASEIFTGTHIEDDRLDRVYSAIRREKENIVLIGMPGSGKSTIGRKLAEKLNRRFFDIDEVIVRRTGMKISSIFEKGGESLFRDIEEQTTADIAANNVGCIIATGGGAVLRAANDRALSRNGRRYFVDRPPEHLIPTSDRPLSSSRADVMRRYQERYPLYVSCADCIIPEMITPNAMAVEIMREFRNH